MSSPWSDRSVLLLSHDDDESYQLAQTLHQTGAKVTVATCAAPGRTQPSISLASDIIQTTFIPASYESLTLAFQLARSRGSLDLIISNIPEGFNGALDSAQVDKVQNPILTLHTTFVIKLTSFYFRRDRDGSLSRGLILISQKPPIPGTTLDPLRAAAASSILGLVRSVAAQASLDKFRLSLLLPDEDVLKLDASARIETLIQGLTAVTKPDEAKLTTLLNGSAYILSLTGTTDIGRPETAIGRVQSYKILDDRISGLTKLATSVRDYSIQLDDLATRWSISVRSIITTLIGTIALLYVYLLLKGWVGIPTKLIWLGLGMWLHKILRTSKTANVPLQPGDKRSIAVFLGSGGHTSEALQLLSALDSNIYTPRTYIHSLGDTMSITKAIEFERSLTAKNPNSLPNETAPRFIEIPRARTVGQGWIGSIGTTLVSLSMALQRLTLQQFKGREGAWDILLVNGPGTCVVVVFALILPKVFGRKTPRTVYVESWARVKTLSLSGKILKHVVDKFVVQWDETGTNGLESGGKTSGAASSDGWLI